MDGGRDVAAVPCFPRCAALLTLPAASSTTGEEVPAVLVDCDAGQRRSLMDLFQRCAPPAVCLSALQVAAGDPGPGHQLPRNYHLCFDCCTLPRLPTPPPTLAQVQPAPPHRRDQRQGLRRLGGLWLCRLGRLLRPRARLARRPAPAGAGAPGCCAPRLRPSCHRQLARLSAVAHQAGGGGGRP